jgi:DNA repair photolyase
MPVRCIDPEKVKKIFTGAIESQFSDYIKERITLQWGGLADPFDMNERRYKVGLSLMEFFRGMKYPVRFSTKGTWWVDNEEYMEIFRGAKNFSMMISIINLDEERARLIERGVDSPAKRFRALEKWVEAGAGDAILRLRPFIFGCSDINDEYLQMIEYAGDIGVKGVSTEFFCLEMRGDDSTVKRYDKMSEAIGFDIIDFYRKNSPGQSGYLRLNPEIKKPYVEKMRALCDKLKIRLSISDAHHKDKGDSGACCALDTKVMKHNKGQFTEVLVLAKSRFVDDHVGEVTWKDMEPSLRKLGFDKFLWRHAQGYNTGSSETRSKRYNMTMYDYFREIWNTPNSGQSPYKYFQGLLRPDRVDSEGNVVYHYAPYGEVEN